MKGCRKTNLYKKKGTREQAALTELGKSSGGRQKVPENGKLPDWGRTSILTLKNKKGLEEGRISGDLDYNNQDLPETKLTNKPGNHYCVGQNRQGNEYMEGHKQPQIQLWKNLVFSQRKGLLETLETWNARRDLGDGYWSRLRRHVVRIGRHEDLLREEYRVEI